MAKKDRIIRLLNMLLQIQMEPGLTALELARNCGIGERQCFRDLRTLQDAGVPVFYDQGYRIIERFRLRDVWFTLEEALALIYGLKLAERQRGLLKIPAGLRLKLLALLPKTLGEEIENIRLRLDVSTGTGGDYSDKQPIFRLLNQAIKSNRMLRMEYYSFSRDALTTREIEPYHLVFSEGFWYLVAFCHLRGEIRLFRVDRIRNLEETGKSFALPADFSYEKYMGAAWGMERGEEFTFKIRFSGDGARYVRETRFHQSQRITEEDDGTVIFTARACGLKAVTRWALSFGREAEVLEPEALRARVAEELSSTMGRYKKNIGQTVVH